MRERENSANKIKTIQQKITEINGSTLNQSYIISTKEVKHEINNILKCIKKTYFLIKSKLISFYPIYLY